MIKILCFKRFTIVIFVFGYQVDALERVVQKVYVFFVKLWSYGTGARFTKLFMTELIHKT